MTMLNVTAAAQAIEDAYNSSPPCNDHVLDHKCCLAAAIRAAADQVVPEELLYGGDQRWMFERDARQESRKKLLAIANELENIND